MEGGHGGQTSLKGHTPLFMARAERPANKTKRGMRRKEQASRRVAEETGALSMETRISRGPRGSIQIVPRPLVLDDR